MIVNLWHSKFCSSEECCLVSLLSGFNTQLTWFDSLVGDSSHFSIIFSFLTRMHVVFLGIYLVWLPARDFGNTLIMCFFFFFFRFLISSSIILRIFPEIFYPLFLPPFFPSVSQARRTIYQNFICLMWHQLLPKLFKIPFIFSLLCWEFFLM